MSQRSATEYVTLKKQRYIPVSKDHFLSVLLDKFESDEKRELFAELASSIETLFYVNRISSVEVIEHFLSVYRVHLHQLSHLLIVTVIQGMLFLFFSSPHLSPYTATR